jgi:GTP-binding protein
MSTGDAIGSIKFANTVILMLDATIALEQQDLTIANYVIDQGRSLVIAVNKWDLIRKKKEYKEEFEYKLGTHLPQVKGIPVVYLSAIDSTTTEGVLDKCIDIYKLWNKKTHLLNWLAKRSCSWYSVSCRLRLIIIVAFTMKFQALNLLINR